MGRKILIPVTYSEVNKKVIAWVNEWGRFINAELHFLHVIPVAMNASLSSLLRKDTVETDQKAMMTFLKQQKIDLPYTASSHMGTTSEIILNAETEGQYDFILMAAHSHTMVGRLVLGSVSDSVLHHSTGSVCFYKQPKGAVDDTIIVPIDFTEINREVIMLADDYARYIGVRLHFVHVIPTQPLDFHKKEIGPVDHDVPSSEAGQKIKDLLADLKIKASHEHTVSQGKPYLKILELQEKTKARLIMMATHSYGDKTHLLPGSVTKSVLHISNASVFVYKKGIQKS